MTLRKHYGYSQDYIASALGMDVVDYMGIENGRRLPTYNQMLRLAKLYRINVAEIFKNTPEVTLHKVSRRTTDEINIKYFASQNSFTAKALRFIKSHVLLCCVILAALIGGIYLLIPKSSNMNLEVKDADRVDVSETTVVYIDSKGSVRGSGDSSNRKLVDLPISDAVDVAEGTSFTAVLLKDGSVETFGLLDKYKEEAERWRNITDIAASGGHLLALNRDGKVYCTGDEYCDIKDFDDIEKVFAFKTSSVGIDKSGNISYTGEIVGSSNFKKYRNVRSIDSSDNITVILFEDGTMDYVCSRNDHFIRATSWKNIKEAACGNDFIAALDNEGNVKIIIDNNLIEEEVGKWRDIITIKAGNNYLVGYDGEKIYGVGANDYEQFESALTNSQITLSEVTGINIVTEKDQIIVSFNPVEHASGYQVSLNVGTGYSKFTSENKTAFLTENMNDGSTYLIEVFALGRGEYSDSRVSQYSFEYHPYVEKPNEDEIIFPVWHNIGKSTEDFINYLKSYGVSDDHVKAEEDSEKCVGDKVYITGVEGYEDGERLNRTQLRERYITYKYCRLGQ